MSPKKHNNIALCKQILSELAGFGLSEFVYCAGSRNAPFIQCLGDLENARIYSFFEERSAAFFALGRARALQKPVAVITTSGTAAAELLPACIEAFHSGVPLVLITTDRPSRLRHTGAPQCIDQTKLMSSFVEQTYDLENSNLRIGHWSLSSPLHINVCLDEPLIDAESAAWSLSPPRKILEPEQGSIGSNVITQKMTEAVLKAERPLIIIGGLDGPQEISAALQLCLDLEWPIYAEACSGLRESPELDGLLLRGGEQLTSHLFKKLKIDLVLRLGSVPTTRLWRDLEESRDKVEVLSVSPLTFSGLSRSVFLQSRVAEFCTRIEWRANSIQKSWQKKIFDLDLKQSEFNEILFLKYPLSEPSLLRRISLEVNKDEFIYVGNSLPIREWDFAASHKNSHQVFANRGVNGIEGQLSSFLGLTATLKKRSWCIVGDLTTLYDLTGPWILKKTVSKNQVFVVMNNGGGKIFHRMYHNPLFENNHELDFSNWAKMWGLDYQIWKGQNFDSIGSSARVLEIVPDADQTQNFWNELSEFVKKL